MSEKPWCATLRSPMRRLLLLSAARARRPGLGERRPRHAPGARGRRSTASAPSVRPASSRRSSSSACSGRARAAWSSARARLRPLVGLVRGRRTTTRAPTRDSPRPAAAAAWRTSAPVWVGARRRGPGAVAAAGRAGPHAHGPEPRLARAASPTARWPVRRRSSRAACGRRTRRSGGRSPSTPTPCGWPTSTTRRARTPTPGRRRRRSSGRSRLYHVKGNGWNDIGYNALVDRFGTVYEGRFGGIDRNVIGAHAGGFNTGSFGIAVLGDFRTATPPTAAVDALVKTLAWRLDLGHVDPLGTLNGISAGNERFGAGRPRVPPRALRAPRLEPDDLSGRAAVRADPGAREAGRRARPAEDLCPGGERGRGGRHAADGEALVRPAVVGRGGRRRRGRAGAERRNGHAGRLDLAAAGTGHGGHAVADRDAGRDARRGHVRRDRPGCGSS